MEDNVIMDCIVVVDETRPTQGNSASSGSKANVQNGQTDNAAAEDMHPHEKVKPSRQSRASTARTRSKVSPSKKRKGKAQPRTQTQRQSRAHVGLENDGANDSVEDADDSMPGLAGSTQAQFSLDPKENRESQNTKPTLNPPQKINDMGTKRPRSPNPGDGEPRKRAVHKSRGEADLRTRTRYRPVQRLSTKVQSKPKNDQSTPVPRRHDMHRGNNRSADSSRRGKDTNVSGITSDIPDDSSSDMPLVVRRGQKKGNLQAESLPGEAEVDSDDLPIASSVRRRLRTRDTSTPESNSDETFSQSQKNAKQPSSNPAQNLENQLAEANQELDAYREALKKERAKNRDLEEIRLLWQAKKLTVQSQDDDIVPRQSPLLPGPRSNPSSTVQTGSPLAPPQITREHQRALDLNKQLQKQLWDAEFAKLRVNQEPRDHKLYQTVEMTEEQVGSKGQAATVLLAEQEKVASIHRQLVQERESGRQGAEKSRDLELQIAELTQKLQQREEALKDETAKRQVSYSKVANQLQQIADGKNEKTAMEKQINDLTASRSRLKQKVDQLTSQLQIADGKNEKTAMEKQINNLTASRSKLEQKVDQLTSQLQETKEQGEDIQEELDWYKVQLEKQRKKYREHMEARDQEERDRMIYILGAYGS